MSLRRKVPQTAGLLLCLAFGVLVGPACSPRTQVQAAAPLRSDAAWVVLPVENASETPHAGEKVELMLSSLLRQRGIREVDPVLPPDPKAEALLALDDRYRIARAMQWARKGDYRYGVTGRVEQWRPGGGPEGEPAVGLSLRVIDLQRRRVVWSGSGAATGWGRESAKETAVNVLETLLQELSVVP